MGINPVPSDPSTLSCTAVLSHFTPITENYFIDLVDHLKPSGSSTDVIPPFFLKQILDVVGPGLLSLINRCLETGTIPDLLKHAIVRPLLKKQGMDPTVLANFRPISNLSFIRKILEKTVLDQLQTFLADNLIFEVFQAGFRKYHSTETALLKVFNSGGAVIGVNVLRYVRLLSAIKKISPLIYSQSWVGSWVYTTQAMMTFTLIF